MEREGAGALLGAVIWKVRRSFETKTLVPLLRRCSLEGVAPAASAAWRRSSSSSSNRPPEILTLLFKITSMVIVYIFDMASPGITKGSLWETYRQRRNMAMIAFFFYRVDGKGVRDKLICTYRLLRLFQWAKTQVWQGIHGWTVGLYHFAWSM